ncbi:M28 family metallopeptidase [Oscillatoria amoena NRMC-F 0135]|nr:M28 family metallopeptidase [Oscillatoria amoena NRMC-F 0135]
MKKPVSFLAILLLIISCSEKEHGFNREDGLASFTVQHLENHLGTLASDEFMGRMPFTEGERKTVAYLEEQLKRLGIEPGNGTSYLQEVPLVNITTTAAPTLTVKASKKSLTLAGLTDYVIWTERTQETISFNDNDMVFAGFGIVAPEYNWNDYEGLNVKDKIVVVMVNDPGFGSDNTSLFKGNTMTYYGRWTYKFEEAARQGAKGVLIIHDDVPAGYGFWVVQNNWNTSRLYLDTRATNPYFCDMVGWVSNPSAKKLFEAAGIDWAATVSAARKPGFKALPMNLKLSTSLSVRARYDKSYNVVGKITGAKQPEEYIIYSTHWDHLGIGKADERGDTIYNGALDNASGTAGILELAKAFKSANNKPNRSLIFFNRYCRRTEPARFGPLCCKSHIPEGKNGGKHQH